MFNAECLSHPSDAASAESRSVTPTEHQNRNKASLPNELSLKSWKRRILRHLAWAKMEIKEGCRGLVENLKHSRIKQHRGQGLTAEVVLYACHGF